MLSRKPYLVLAIVAGFVLAWAGATPAAAQDTGTITGRVADASTDVPISGAQVFLPGTGIGTLSGDDGRFLLVNVPVGTHELRAVRIGFEATSREVAVQAGESRRVDLALQEAVLGLDEIVVTGEAGQARRREVGNTISEISMADVSEPVVNMESLMQGRAAGLSITEASGMAGSGSQIRLRGNVSVAMSNQPLIYIDGVRMRSDAYPKNVPPVGYSGRSGNIKASPLNDIDPSDIARIEIIKGAAATTLYGTEAASGVIQIFTKRGQEGQANWTFQTDQGFSKLLPFGPPDYPYYRMDPWLRNGHRQRYHVSARGGRGDMNYFVSGSWEDNEHVLPNDWENKATFRGNFGFDLLDDLSVQWNTSFTLNQISNTPGGNNAHGITLNTYRGNTNYVGGYSKESVDRLLDYEITTDIDHFITGLTTHYTPTDNFSHRFNVGFARAATEGRQVRPFGFVLSPQGIMSNRRWSSETTTVDYAGNYRLPLTDDFGSTWSWGGQFVEEFTRSVTGYAEEFPGPGEPTLSSGALSLSFENRMRVITGGFFGQARFDWLDRVFLTAGLRIDGNSAFGQNLGLQPYPKASLSYVISDESFWNPSWGNVKLRAAYGHSGRAPGAFDAVRTWTPSQLGSQPAYLPRNPGNAELGPERTAEFEIGFDASLLNDRVRAEFTYYDQTTTDALFPVRRPPSAGGWEAQLENVGTLRNSGVELVLDGTVIENREFGWDLGLIVSTNHSEVLDLGDAASFTIGSYARIEEGYPAPVLRGRLIENPHETADPVITEEHYFGPNQPTLILTPRTSLRLPAGIQISARGEYQGGHYIYDGASANGVQRETEWPPCMEPWAMMDAGNTSQLTAVDRARCDTENYYGDKYIYPADYFKLRDVTAQLPIDFLVPWGTNPRLSLSARNFVRWFNDGWWAMDPEMGSNVGHDSQVREIGEHVPPTATFTASLRINF